MEEVSKINLGCEECKEKGFLNIDIDPECNPDKVANMINLDFIKDNSVELVVTYHTVEHLWPDEVPLFFKEMKRVIKKGGRLIIECPDLEKCMEILKQDINLGLRAIFGAGPEDELELHRVKNKIPFLHKFGFTKAILKKYLEENGFKILNFYNSIKYHGHPERDTGVEAVRI